VAALFLVPNRMREEQATNESVAGVSPVTAGVAQPVASMAMPFVDAEALGLVRTAPQKAPVSAFGGD